MDGPTVDLSGSFGLGEEGFPGRLGRRETGVGCSSGQGAPSVAYL